MKSSVLYISIDAVHPQIIFNAEKYGLKIPFLKSLIKKSVYAKNGVYGVYPTLTFSCHATMVTGVTPEKHGMANNIYFDPCNRSEKDPWSFFAPVDGKIDNLWSVAKKNGYITANNGFPCTIGADIDYDIVCFWRDSKDKYNENLFNCLCSPRWILKEIEKDTGYIPGCMQRENEDDITRGKIALWLLENKLKKTEKPFFLSHYITVYDAKAHKYGTYGKEALESIEKMDSVCQKIEEKALEISGGNLVTCVVSDHGMADIYKTIKINTAFLKEGFIKSDDCKRVKSWDAYCHFAHGMAEVKLKNLSDSAFYHKVENLLRNLASDKNNGIKKVYGREEIKTLKSFSDSDFVLEAEIGYRFANYLEGELIEDEKSYVATHGYSPEFEEMRSFFFIKGKGIPQGEAKDNINLVDLAPTLAGVMGFELPNADGKNILLPLS